MKGLDSANDIFHLLNWQIFNHFNGKYEAIVYKLCKDYIGVCRTPYMTVFEFRDYIGLNESEYTEFKELNRWTISLPIKNINESPVSDIIVTAEFERKGRKVEGLYFTVKPKHQAALPPAEPESSLAFALAKVTITPQEQEDYLKLLSIEQIQHCIERANEYGEDLEKKGKKVHYRAVYKSAITENWGEQHQQIKVLTVKEEPKKDSVKPTPPDPAQNSLQQLPERFTQLSADEKHSVISLFISNQKGITKARMQAEYAGSKLAILDSSAFMTPFVLFLGKHWS
jgi:plasmid replication initiation protein